VAEGELPANPLVGLDPPVAQAKPVPVLSDVDLARILKACAGKEFRDRRDEAVIRVLLDCGIRVSELCGNKVTDLDLDREVAGHREGEQGAPGLLRCPYRPRPRPLHPGPQAQATRPPRRPVPVPAGSPLPGRRARAGERPRGRSRSAGAAPAPVPAHVSPTTSSSTGDRNEISSGWPAGRRMRCSSATAPAPPTCGLERPRNDFGGVTGCE